MATPLKKQPSESRLYTMDFRKLMASSETITAVSSVTIDNITTPALTKSAGAINGQKVQVRLAAGKDGEQYKITVVITTSDGNTLEGDGELLVEEL